MFKRVECMLSYKNIIAKQSLGIQLDDVERHAYNLWLGISLGNNFFTEEHLRAVIEFALHFTKEKVLVLIPGRMQASNYMHLEDFSRAKSLRKAFAEEDRKTNEIMNIISNLDASQTQLISVASYDDVCTPEYIKQRELLFREFSKEEMFYSDVIDVVEEIINSRKRTLFKKRSEGLALYVLNEIPFFLNGVQKLDSTLRYEVVVYPGVGGIDRLVNKIAEIDSYDQLRAKLKLVGGVGILDIGVDNPVDRQSGSR